MAQAYATQLASRLEVKALCNLSEDAESRWHWRQKLPRKSTQKQKVVATGGKKTTACKVTKPQRKSGDLSEVSILVKLHY